MRANKLLIFLALPVLCACQQTPYGVEGPLLYEVARKQTLVVLNRPLTIPVQRARTYLQFGREISAQQVDRFESNCEFEVRTLRNVPVRINPDTFMVTKVTYDEDGSEGFLTGMHLEIGSGATIKYITTIKISSPRQPDVLQMICSWEEGVTRGHQLSFEQFKAAVGPYITLRAQ